MTKIGKKNFIAGTIYIFEEKNNCNLLIPWPPIMDFHATREAFSRQKRTSSTSKLEISYHFFLWVSLTLCLWIRFRIHADQKSMRNRIRNTATK
jgi:hypothetical protein